MIPFEPARARQHRRARRGAGFVVEDLVAHDAQHIRIGGLLGIALANDASMTMETMIRRRHRHVSLQG